MAGAPTRRKDLPCRRLPAEEGAASGLTSTSSWHRAVEVAFRVSEAAASVSKRIALCVFTAEAKLRRVAGSFMSRARCNGLRGRRRGEREREGKGREPWGRRWAKGQRLVKETPD